jgi:predicted Zn-dependent protease
VNRLVLVTLVATGLAAALGCATNPVTGESQLALVSEAQEIEMGRAAADEVRQSIGLVDDPALQQYVGRIGTTMAARSERPRLPWSFAVVDDPTPNAFALPGGFIFVTRGLMALLGSEAELATVLGHEIGHVTARHSVTAISRQQLAQLGLGIGGLVFPEVRPFGQAIEAGLGLLFLEHGRDAERQADDLGFRYALDRGYDVTAMADVFQTLQRAGGEQRSALPAWLTTHPAPEDRIAAVRARLAELPANRHGTRVERADYLQQIDELVYGENPRHGFFRDGSFIHPELRFRFAVPEGWDARNLTRAVTAVSPGRDAALQLTMTGATDPTQAAQRFYAQGPAPLRSTRTQINGQPAVLSLFEAATAQGRLRGLVAHVASGGRVYQLIGYAPVGRFAAYEAALEPSIRSFDRVTNPALLEDEPQRLDIVRVADAMTLAEFARRFDAAVPIAELAVLNQLEGAAARVDAGTLLKRVVS